MTSITDQVTVPVQNAQNIITTDGQHETQLWVLNEQGSNNPKLCNSEELFVMEIIFWAE